MLAEKLQRVDGLQEILTPLSQNMDKFSRSTGLITSKALGERMQSKKA